MLKEIAKAILNEMALIEEAESDGGDRWDTLKGYLEAVISTKHGAQQSVKSDACQACGTRDAYSVPDVFPNKCYFCGTHR